MTQLKIVTNYYWIVWTANDDPVVLLDNYYYWLLANWLTIDDEVVTDPIGDWPVLIIDPVMTDGVTIDGRWPMTKAGPVIGQ